MLHAAANLVNWSEYGTLILDRLGKILSCGEPAERIFGASQVQLMGRPIADFIAGLLFGGTSPSYSARYLAHLCAGDAWRKFEATNALGQGFTVEINLSRRVTEGREVVVLNLRQPEDTSCRQFHDR